MGREETEGVYLISATLYVMVNRKKRGVGVNPIPSQAWANFIMMECNQESGRCLSVYSVVCNVLKNVRVSVSVLCVHHNIKNQSSLENGKN
jgi:hypothetical protein